MSSLDERAPPFCWIVVFRQPFVLDFYPVARKLLKSYQIGSGESRDLYGKRLSPLFLFSYNTYCPFFCSPQVTTIPVRSQSQISSIYDFYGEALDFIKSIERFGAIFTFFLVGGPRA